MMMKRLKTSISDCLFEFNHYFAIFFFLNYYYYYFDVWKRVLL